MTQPPPDRSTLTGHPPGWQGGWRRYLFPGLWLAYLMNTAGGVSTYSHGWLAGIGYALLVVFGFAYLATLAVAWSNRRRLFWAGYVGMLAICLIEVGLARDTAFVMLIFLTVLTVGQLRTYALPVVALYTAIAVFLPAMVPSWHTGVRGEWAVTIPLVGLAMYGFFNIIRTNVALAAARAEVARLAAENERTRIARDLHDLLGHSLTAITVKAGLARRLAELGEPDRAATEIGEVARLGRRSLADVRAAVAGHREITLAGELATAREVLRASAIMADFPGSVDIVDPTLSELFGWVVREGVTNVVRHSRANRCTVTFGPGWIEIEDNGHGGVASAGTGSGLAGLRERVAAAGGTVQISPSPVGFRLRVDVPTPVSAPQSCAPAPPAADGAVRSSRIIGP